MVAVGVLVNLAAGVAVAVGVGLAVRVAVAVLVGPGWMDLGSENSDVLPLPSVAVAVMFGPANAPAYVHLPPGAAVTVPWCVSPWSPRSEKISMEQPAQAVPDAPPLLALAIVGAGSSPLPPSRNSMP
jgi:hypothetical protein